jgi:hypothetical protein
MLRDLCHLSQGATGRGIGVPYLLPPVTRTLRAFKEYGMIPVVRLQLRRSDASFGFAEQVQLSRWRLLWLCSFLLY